MSQQSLVCTVPNRRRSPGGLQYPNDQNGRTFPLSATLIVLDGEFDLADRDQLADAFEFAAQDSVVIVDLNRMAYMDSTVLWQLMKLRSTMAERNAKLLLTQPTGIVWRLFEVTQVDALFEIRPSVHQILVELDLAHDAAKRITLVGGRQPE